MKNKILFLLFIFSALGFLFFKVDFARGADGVCTCEVFSAATGDPEGIQDIEKGSESEGACSELESTSSAGDDKVYKNCFWQYAGGVCGCEVKNNETEEVSYEEDDSLKTKKECTDLVGTTAGNLVYQDCTWKEEVIGPIVTEETVEAVVDIPSVAGLNTLQNTDVKVIFGNAIRVAMGLMGSIALALFAYAGVLWMLSGGNAEKATKARNILVWATMGLFVILASYTIVSFIFSAVE